MKKERRKINKGVHCKERVALAIDKTGDIVPLYTPSVHVLWGGVCLAYFVFSFLFVLFLTTIVLQSSFV